MIYDSLTKYLLHSQEIKSHVDVYKNVQDNGEFDTRHYTWFAGDKLKFSPIRLCQHACQCPANQGEFDKRHVVRAWFAGEGTA